ncbi:MAG: hypothetical protein JRH20_24680, partial [Deltaproteobacteria bacterium]|nr:hypothetical protein [Deltaproteobacteria bacterium]
LLYVPKQRARKRELVSVGVPIADESQVRDASEFGLEGAGAGQFRVLQRYPSGNVQWVLASFLASVDKGHTARVDLVGGQGDFGAAPLASETAETILVDTGAAIFRIRKAQFNLLDSVLMDGREMLKRGGDLIGTDDAGVEYSSVRDPAPSVVLEENGPVKAVVRVRGHLVAESGAELLAYIARMTFQREGSGVNLEVSLANDEAAHDQARHFVSLRARMPMALDSAPTYTFVGNDEANPFGGTLQAGQTARIFQGFSKFLGDSTYLLSAEAMLSSWGYPAEKLPLPGTDTGQAGGFEYTVDDAYVGLQVEAAGQVLQAAGDERSFTLGYADVADEHDNGVAVAYRWMAAYWPASFDVDGDGVLEVGLWSQHQPKSVVVEWGGRLSRSVRLDFHRAAFDPRTTLYQLQYPLVGRAPFAHYRDVGAVFGQRELVTTAEEKAYFANYGHEEADYTDPRFAAIVRRVHWRRNYTHHVTSLMHFMRTGHATWYHRAREYANFFVDKAIAHSADTDLSTLDLNISPAPRGQDAPDHEHQMSKVLALMYWMSGDEKLRDGIGDYGEYLRWQEDGRMPSNYLPSSFRAWLRYVKNFAWLYDFTYDDAYADVVRRCADFIIDGRDDPKSPTVRGRSLERGYFHWNGRGIHSYFGTEIFGEVSFQMLRMFRTYPAVGYERREDFEDALLGIAQFHFEEAGWRNGFFSWIIYDYLLDEANPYSEPDDPSTANDPFDWYVGSRWLGYLYNQLGQEQWFEKHADISYGYKGTEGRNMLAKSRRLDQQQSFYLDMKRPPPRYGWKEVPNVQVTSDGGGSYTLSWEVPPEAAAYKLKYAAQPIVEWLGFDQMARQFAVDPVTHVPYFAAMNVNDEPEPLSPGVTQSTTVSGLGSMGPVYFSLRYSTNTRD